MSGLSVAGMISASWAEFLFNSYRQTSYLNKQFDAKVPKYFLQLIVVFFIKKYIIKITNLIQEMIKTD